MDLKEQEILGESMGNHWYYRSKAAALARSVADMQPQRILDVGAGSGFFSKEMLRHTSAEEAVCVDTSYSTDRDEAIDGKHIRYRRKCDFVNADLVLMMDVLEHVDDDLGLLQEYVSLTPQRARFLISVPAFSFLWSEHDVFLDHKRRYTLGEVEHLARRAGLVVVRGSYYFGAVFPLVAARRILGNFLNGPHHAPRSHLTQHSGIANAILTMACAAEIPFFRFNRLAGLTAFCLARRP